MGLFEETPLNERRENLNEHHAGSGKGDPGQAVRLLLGLMCGTSGDGVSVALIETSGYGTDRQVHVVDHLIIPYPSDLRRRLFALFPPKRFTAAHLAHLHRDIGELLAEASLQVLVRSGHTGRELTGVAVQSPTLFHEPPSAETIGCHIEVGEAAIISERIGAPVVCDLRPNDIVAGGHGAPLSAYVDYVLFANPECGRAVQNIGGIANVTFLRAGVSADQVLCFDTGPGNMVIDGLVSVLTKGREAYDSNGNRAARGQVNEILLKELMEHPYLALHPPKTTGREDFGEPFVTRVLHRARQLGVSEDDVVATATAYTAECISYHYRRYLLARYHLDEVILYGGGAHNPTLVDMIKARLAPIPIRLHDEFGISGDAREAVTWAILGDETLAGRPANVPAASGARHPVVLGKIVCVPPGRGRWIAS